MRDESFAKTLSDLAPAITEYRALLAALRDSPEGTSYRAFLCEMASFLRTAIVQGMIHSNGITAEGIEAIMRAGSDFPVGLRQSSKAA